MQIRQTHFLRGVTLALLFSIPCIMRAEITPAEARTVRTAYARLTFATQIKVVEDYQGMPAKEFNEHLVAATLYFDVTLVSGGDVAEIMNTPVRDLVDPQQGDALQIGPGVLNANDFGVPITEPYATARWIKGRTFEGTAADMWNTYTFKQMMGPGSGNELDKAVRFVKLNVVATLAGKSRSYKALFVFDREGKGSSLDMVAGSEVAQFADQPVYPAVELQGSFARANANVRGWLAATAVPGCRADGKTECCDLDSLKCGVPLEDVQKSKDMPEGPVTPKGSAANSSKVSPQDASADSCSSWSGTGSVVGPYSSSDKAQHILGNDHSVIGDYFGSCVYSSPPFGPTCATVAKASFTGMTSDTEGVISPPFCHVANYATTEGIGSGIGAVTSTQAVVAAAASNCLFCGCGVSISIGAGGGTISFPASTVWTHTVNYQAQCIAHGLHDQHPTSGGGGGGGGTSPPVGVPPCVPFYPGDPFCRPPVNPEQPIL